MNENSCKYSLYILSLISGKFGSAHVNGQVGLWLKEICIIIIVICGFYIVTNLILGNEVLLGEIFISPNMPSQE